MINSELSQSAILFYKKRLEFFGFSGKKAKKLFNRWKNNRELAINERNSKEITLKSKPLYVDVELNNSCNLKCKFCPCLYSHNNTKLEEADIDILLEFCRYAEVIETSKAAEPFLTPNLFILFLKKLRKINPFAIVHTVTNGTCLTEELLKSIVEQRLDHIYISINSHNAELYNELTDGIYKNVINNIKRINKTKGRLREPYLHFNCQLSKYADAIKVLAIADKMNVCEVNFVKTMVDEKHPFYDKALQNYMSNEEIEKYFDKIWKKASEYGIYINFGGWNTQPRPVAGRIGIEYYPHATKYYNSQATCPIDAPWFRFCTVMDIVAPCCWAPAFANWKNESFDNIWNGEHLRNMRQNIKDGIYPKGCFCKY